jgi:dTDP-4-dehydrorhamnose 3,5-epimerase
MALGYKGAFMIFYETKLSGAFLIEPEKRSDHRGFFARSFCRLEFQKYGLNPDIFQSNIGFSQEKGTVRGLHFQLAPFAETKLIRCTSGSLYDVIVDLRPDSSTYRQWFSVELNCLNRTMLYVPEGFAHGYMTLTERTEVFYQVSQSYVPSAEMGIRWNDPSFNFEWPDMERIVISEKDQTWPDWSI